MSAMTEKDLVFIEERAINSILSGMRTPGLCCETLAEDIPALAAEIRRLRPITARRKLWDVTDGGVSYWVSAIDESEALALVREIPDFEEDESCPFDATAVPPGRAEKATFRFEDGKTCSMWNAFELVCEHSTVLACSEWP